MRRTGLGVLVLQFIGLAVWSQTLISRFAPGTDFVGYGQAWYLIAHGHLNPFVSGWNELFFKDHGSFIVVLLAPLWWVWPHAVTLLWVQCAAIVVGEAVAFIWICEVAGTISEKRQLGGHHKPEAGTGWLASIRMKVDLPPALAVLGLVLLVANPWIYWAASFDFHFELVGSCFAILLAYDIAHHHRRAWLWFLLTIISGDVAITYAMGVGISAILAGKPWRRQGATLIALAAGAFGIENAFGLSRGSGITEYLQSARSSHPAVAVPGQRHQVVTSGIGGLNSLFRAVFTRPLQYLDTLRSHFLNIYANLAPAGGIGLLCAWGVGVPLVVLLENNLRAGVLFSATPFQNFPIYLFVALGTIMVLAWIASHWRTLTWVIGSIVVVSSIGWMAAWFPKTSNTWLRVSPAAAEVLNWTLAQLPPNDEVVATHGVVGAFSERTKLISFQESVVPIFARHVWFVLAPEQGIETVPVPVNLSNLATLAGPMHAKLVAHGGGVWVFRWDPPSGTTTAVFPGFCSTVPAWPLPTNAGRPLLSGPASGWRIDATGQTGYVAWGDYWRLPKGSYVAGIRLSSNGPVSLQVWDSDRQELIAQRQVPSTQADGVVSVPFDAPTPLKRPSTEGSGPFRLMPVQPPPNDQIEVRVYSPGGTAMYVSSITVLRSSHAEDLVASAHAAC
ncbi:MAG: DUF2079 domain-containing protein [Acidimicrobiales bacterium]